MIFCLTGCGGKTQYLHTKISLTNWDIIGVINEASEQIGLSIAKTINSTFAITMKFLYSLPDEMKKTSISSLSEYTEFFRIVTIVQILAIALIVVNYAKSVAKHNMLQQGSTVSAITHLKKITVAILAVFLVPYICISAYMASVYAASALPSLLNATTKDGEGTWDIYTQMDEDGVALYTYCQSGQTAYGVSDLTDLRSSTDYNGNGTIGVIMTDSTDLANKYCGGTNSEYRNVFEAMQNSKEYSKTLIVGGEFNGGNLFAEYTKAKFDTGATAILSIVFVIIFLIIWIFTLLATLKRIIDLMVLIATSWYYIGSSVADEPNENSIGSLWKKLLSICLTNFILLLEYCIWLALVVDKDPIFTLSSLVVSVLWLKVLTATPTAVESMIVSTNTASNAASNAAGAGKAAASFFRNR